MIHSGVQPVRPDHRDYSYPGTFGAVTSFPDELNLDAFPSVFPDQNADGYPNGCTGYAQTSICEDEDKVQYQPAYTYDQTRLMEGTFPDPVPCAMRTSLNSTIVYGVLGKDEIAHEQASYHRRGAFYNVVDSPNLDAFDDVRSAIVTNNRSVSVATPWFSEWENPIAGVVPMPYSKPATYHNWKICGWKQIGGQPYLIGKSWQGANFGDHGYHYVSRAVFNKVMAMSGTGAFTVRKALPGDYKTVKLAMLETLISYLRMLMARSAKAIGSLIIK